MDLLMLDPVSEDQLSLFVIFVGSGSTILDVDCGSIFVGSIVVGFIVTGSESFVIGSVVVRSVLNFGCHILLSLKIHSVLWPYAPVNWGVGSVFQLQKMHIYYNHCHQNHHQHYHYNPCHDYHYHLSNLKIRQICRRMCKNVEVKRKTGKWKLKIRRRIKWGTRGLGSATLQH